MARSIARRLHNERRPPPRVGDAGPPPTIEDVNRKLKGVFLKISASSEEQSSFALRYFNRVAVAKRSATLSSSCRTASSSRGAPLYEEKHKYKMRTDLVDEARQRRRGSFENVVVYECVSPMTAYDEHADAEKADTVEFPEDESDETLMFESRFESGNLWSATQVGPYEYNLRVRPDWNTTSYAQWYYFAIANTRKGLAYKFNIINMRKKDSLYNYGMQPLTYSCKSTDEKGAAAGGWKRSGERVCYYRGGGKGHRTLTFTYTAEHSHDTVFFAYSFPYTTRALEDDLSQYCQNPRSRVFVRREVLRKTALGRPVYLLKITDPSVDEKEKKHVFLSARCHPGESNSSWMCKGALEFMLSDDAEAAQLRKLCVIHCVPMLNPDGVYLGNYRCSFKGVDMNRKWASGEDRAVPVIRRLKKRLAALRKRHDAPLLLATDMHGHSKKMTAFMYGCRGFQYIGKRREESREGIFPFLLQELSPHFSFAYCRFAVPRSKLSTARAVLWQELGVETSYTMEVSFAGMGKGRNFPRGLQFGHRDLMQLGVQWCRALLRFADKNQRDTVAKSLGTWIQSHGELPEDSGDDSFDEDTRSSDPPRKALTVSADPRMRRLALEQAIADGPSRGRKSGSKSRARRGKAATRRNKQTRARGASRGRGSRMPKLRTPSGDKRQGSLGSGGLHTSASFSNLKDLRSTDRYYMVETAKLAKLSRRAAPHRVMNAPPISKEGIGKANAVRYFPGPLTQPPQRSSPAKPRRHTPQPTRSAHRSRPGTVAAGSTRRKRRTGFRVPVPSVYSKPELARYLKSRSQDPANRARNWLSPSDRRFTGASQGQFERYGRHAQATRVENIRKRVARLPTRARKEDSSRSQYL